MATVGDKGLRTVGNFFFFSQDGRTLE